MAGEMALPHSAPRPRPETAVRLLHAYFGSPARGLITLLFLLLAFIFGPSAIKWLLLNATFFGNAEACRLNGGACWAFIATKFNLILFGPYPTESLWRPILFLALVAAVAVYGLFARRSYIWVIGLWIVADVLGYLLMSGDLPGLTPVDRARWGGLPITIGISIAGLASAFPLGVLLALGGNSKNHLISTPSRLYVDVVRGIPAITVVFMTFAIIPLILPKDIVFDKLFRAGVGLTLFTAAYFAEALRGALQALPRGQTEAAASLGIGYWKANLLVVLPQVISASLQPIGNISIAFVKNSSLLIIIGLFDLLGSARSSLYDGNWQGFYKELYLFVGLIYLGICLFIQFYIASIERERETRISR
jgi:general L-amino acid transport system permease protein